jgi:hypothetical protein
VIKNIKILTIITFIFGILIFLFSFLDFAALHDIGSDYISREILTYLDITTSKNLPDWTKTEGEWVVVTVSLFLRIIFLILNTFVLYYYYKKIIPKINRT